MLQFRLRQSDRLGDALVKPRQVLGRGFDLRQMQKRIVAGDEFTFKRTGMKHFTIQNRLCQVIVRFRIRRVGVDSSFKLHPASSAACFSSLISSGSMSLRFKSAMSQMLHL